MPSTSHTTRPETPEDPGVEKVGQYQAIPVTLPDGSVTYLLTDIRGRLISIVQSEDDHGVYRTLRSDHFGNLHVAGPHGIQAAMVNEPGLAYANGVNALCLAAPEDEDHHLEVSGVYLSTNAAGSFYLVAGNLGVTPGTTSVYTFDLVGVMGSDLVRTCDVIWASFLANQGRGVTGGNYQMSLLDGEELYLLAPDVTYHIHVNYMDES